jgi:hypothetical protein
MLGRNVEARAIDVILGEDENEAIIPVLGSYKLKIKGECAIYDLGKTLKAARQKIKELGKENNFKEF